MDPSQLAWKNMRAGIDNQVELLRTAPAELYRDLASTVSVVPDKVYIVGCGDSYFAGVAMRQAFESMTGLCVEPLEAMEFSRYAVRNASRGALVVAVSNSGEVARTVEALKFAQQFGMKTMAVTYNPDSSLAHLGDTVLNYRYRDAGFGPGTMSYLASMLSLYCLALRLAELNGQVGSQKAPATALDTVSRLAESLQATIDACEEPAGQVASRLSDKTPYFILGAGPSYGTALFGMAKMIEAARHNTVAQQLEEWAHEQFFCCEPGTITLVIAPTGQASDRAREQLRAIREMGGTSIAVCPEHDWATRELADLTLPVVGEISEELSPLVYMAALELVALRYAISNDKVMLGFDDPQRQSVNFRQIFESAIPQGLDVGSGRC